MQDLQKRPPVTDMLLAECGEESEVALRLRLESRRTPARVVVYHSWKLKDWFSARRCSGLRL